MSSLKIIQIKRIGILLIIQIINALVCLSLVIAEFYFNFFFPQEVQYYIILFALFVFIGFIAGFGYVNICYIVYNECKCLPEEKELAMNILTFMDDTLVLTASITSIILSLTIFE